MLEYRAIIRCRESTLVDGKILDNENDFWPNPLL
jgi:hypothetical protein